MGQEADEKQLQALRRELSELREDLNRYQGEQESTQKQLQSEELELARLHREISGTQRSIAISQDVSEQLQLEAENLGRLRKTQENLVSREIRAMYKSGKQEPIKMLLNQQDPGELSLMLGYYQRLIDTRRERLDQYRTTMLRLSENQLARIEEQQRSQALLENLANQQQQLAASHDRRQRTLASLSAEIANTEQQINQKEADRDRLERLIKNISSRMEELELPNTTVPFSEIRGACHWPAEGKMVASFGSLRTGSLRWNGVLIGAEDGTEVEAIHTGRVLFADYLRGYGLLVIIDHDAGYLTLYGHNQYLYVELGDWVQAGQPIARVGETGGLQEPGLYFEIRQQGTPVDPAGWCR